MNNLPSLLVIKLSAAISVITPIDTAILGIFTVSPLLKALREEDECQCAICLLLLYDRVVVGRWGSSFAFSREFLHHDNSDLVFSGTPFGLEPTRRLILCIQKEVAALSTIPGGLPGSSILSEVIRQTSSAPLLDNVVHVCAVEDPTLLQIGVIELRFLALGGNTRDLGSFGEETDEITDLHQIIEEALLTKRGDGVASIKRRHRDPSGDDVWNLETASGRSRLKKDLESSM
ncbi:hypothetical protein Tco_1420950 [Tanacetum coccineum]